ncbi:hypothetical protein ACSBR2_033454 [Camellia fascicularis]
MVKLATQASVYKPAYQLVDEGIKELCTKVNKMMVSFDDLGDCGSGSNIDMTSNHNFARVKGLKKKGEQKGGGRLKPWHEKTNKRKKIISQPTDLSKKIGQSSNTLIVQSSSLGRSQDVGIPYWPQLMNYGHNLFKLDDTNIACSSSYPQSTPLSSQLLVNPQTSQGMSFDEGEVNPMGNESFLDNETFLKFCSHSQPPPQN